MNQFYKAVNGNVDVDVDVDEDGDGDGDEDEDGDGDGDVHKKLSETFSKSRNQSWSMEHGLR
jgi:hypothetical protein